MAMLVSGRVVGTQPPKVTSSYCNQWLVAVWILMVSAYSYESVFWKKDCDLGMYLQQSQPTKKSNQDPSIGNKFLSKLLDHKGYTFTLIEGWWPTICICGWISGAVTWCHSKKASQKVCQTNLGMRRQGYWKMLCYALSLISNVSKHKGLARRKVIPWTTQQMGRTFHNREVDLSCFTLRRYKRFAKTILTRIVCFTFQFRESPGFDFFSPGTSTTKGYLQKYHGQSGPLQTMFQFQSFGGFATPFW